jgi:hypothetical protein
LFSRERKSLYSRQLEASELLMPITSPQKTMREPLFQSILYPHPNNSRKGLSWKVEEREKVGRGGRGR